MMVHAVHTHTHINTTVARGNLAGLFKHGSESNKSVRASVAPWTCKDANICYCHGHGYGACV